MSFRILLVEDSESDIATFSTTIDRLNDSLGDDHYSVDVAKSLKEANSKIDGCVYNGSVVDIRLRGDEDGNDFISSLMEKCRIPIIAYTGTPDVDAKIKCFKKGEQTPEEVINELEAEEATGMFKVMGGKGRIEKNITNIFWKVLYPHMDVWTKYYEEGVDTEEVILRYTVAHLLENLGYDGPSYCTEEMYILGVDGESLRTGELFENENTHTDYVLLSPPCDLALRDGKPKTDSFLLCEVEPLEWKDIKNGDIKSIVKNNMGENYHWLPDNVLYKGGRVNFRKLVTCSSESFKTDYKYKKVKIQDAFVKSMLQRFSAYYSRQGQPDFNFEKEFSVRKKNQ